MLTFRSFFSILYKQSMEEYCRGIDVTLGDFPTIEDAENVVPSISHYASTSANAVIDLEEETSHSEKASSKKDFSSWILYHLLLACNVYCEHFFFFSVVLGTVWLRYMGFFLFFFII